MAIALLSCNTTKNTNYVDYVDPNLGADHSRWFFYTPASEPFGMAKLGPSTNGTYGNLQGWEAVGYEDRHASIDGFPCFREFQIGGVSLMPVVGDLITKPGMLEEPENGFRSRFDKSREVAYPGYYSVILDDYNVKAELTASSRVGFQRFTFPKSTESRIILNIGNRQGESGPVKDSYIKQIDDYTIEGYVTTEPEYVKKYQLGASVTMYFYAKVDRAPHSINVFYQDGELLSGNEINGKGAMMSLNYETENNDQVTIKVGLSYTSIENAQLNYVKEVSDKSFDMVANSTLDKWNDYLGRIEVSGSTHENKVKFYTGLYHALLGRGLASDINGAYPKNDGTIGHIPLSSAGTPIHNHYNTDAIWGAYWNLTPLWALAYPDYYNDFVNSQLLVYKDAGWLGDGIATSRYVSGVGTNMVSIAIAGAYNCGIRNFDIETAYEAALKNEVEWKGRIEGAGKMDVRQFVEKGYVPYENSYHFGTHDLGSTFAASHTLEYSFSSYAVAQLAKSLGRSNDYDQLIDLSKGWERLFNDSLKMIHPRSDDGKFIDDFDPLESWRGFQEGNAMQYTFYVPHAPRELVKRLGVENFNNRLDSIFLEAQKTIFGGGKVLDAFSGLESPYNHGNQPSLHISWLFNFSGKPYLTQKWTRAICDEFYGITGEHGYGYGQDEDQGQLGAWFVMSSMGLFDVKGLSDSDVMMQIGSPIFDKVKIKLNEDYYSGNEFVLETINNSSKNKYIQTVELNGEKTNNVFIPFEDIVEGGVLKLNMGEKPNMKIK